MSKRLTSGRACMKYEERRAILDRLELKTLNRYKADKSDIAKIAALWWMIGYLGAWITDEDLARIDRDISRENV